MKLKSPVHYSEKGCKRCLGWTVNMENTGEKQVLLKIKL